MTKILKNISISTIMVLSIATLNVNALGIYEADNIQASKMEKKRNNAKRTHFKRMAKVLSLTEAQKEEIKTIKNQARNDAKVLRTNLAGFKDGMEELMNKSNFDDAAFAQLHGEYQEVFAQLALLKAKSKFEVMQVLDEEQRERAKELKKQRKNRLFH